MSNNKHFTMASSRRLAFNNFKRVVSMMLVLVTLLGILPVPAVAADTRNDVPATIQLTGFDSYGAFSSPTLGSSEIHYIKTKVNGNVVTAFCGNHHKSLTYGVTYNAATFSDGSNYVSKDGGNRAPYMIFLDYYYSISDNPTSNAICQAAVWLMRNDYEGYAPLMSASVAEIRAGTYDSLFNALARDGVAAAKKVSPGYDKTADWLAGCLKEDVVIKWLEGQIEKRDYAIYQAGNAYQDLIVPLPPDPPSDDPEYVWLKVKKVDQDGNPLAGAEFTIYPSSNTEHDVPLDTIVTDSSGEAYWKYRLVGMETEREVWVKETKAPDGYNLIDTPFQVVMQKGVHVSKATAAYVNGGPIKNWKESEGFIKKVDQYGNGVAGAKIRIYGTAFDKTPVDDSYLTEEGGVIKIQWTDPRGENYVKPGSYTVEETEPPPGYRPTDEVEHITLFEDGTKSGNVIFTNEKFRTIELIKQDPTGKRLPGAVFKVERDGQDIGSITTGDDGSFMLEGENGTGLLPGLYTFTEVTAPDGYLLPANPVHSVWLFPEGDTKEHYVVTAVNYAEPDIEIEKISKETGEGLAGATFEVRIDDETIGTYKTDKNGKIRIPHSVYGDFLRQGKESWTIAVREVSAPPGYLVDDENWHTAELHQGEKLKTFTFTDTPYSYIRILKRDRETGEPLPNTSFHVWINGKDIGTHVTDTFGVITIDYETYGRYLDEHNHDNWTITVQEVEMPDKYNKDKQDASGDYTLTQTLKWGQKYAEFVFKDTHFRDLRITKRDSSNTWTLADATFTLDSLNLENEKGGPIHREGKTDANGQLTFKDLPNGTYRVTETVPPTGYSLADPNWQDVTITSYSDRVIDIEFLNAPEQGLLIRKLDATTKQNLAGVKFEIRYLGTADSSSGTTNDPMEKITDSNGLIYMPDCRRLSAST